jgi:peptide/nickel transport system ATP-binding protein
MYPGRILDVGPAVAIFAEPTHPCGAALTAARLSAARRKRSFQPRKGGLSPRGCPFRPRCEQAMPVDRGVRSTLTEIAPGRSAACHLSKTPEAA